MMLAKRMGLDVPKVQILMIGDLPLYIISRYDRTIAGDQVVRLIQEDFCQALKVNSQQKHFRALSEEIGIKPNLVTKTIIDMSEKILEASKETTIEFKEPYTTVSIVDQINNIIKNHAYAMIQELS